MQKQSIAHKMTNYLQLRPLVDYRCCFGSQQSNRRLESTVFQQVVLLWSLRLSHHNIQLVWLSRLEGRFGSCVLNVSGSSTNRAINFLSANFTSQFAPFILYQGSKSRNRGIGGEVLIAKIQKQEVRPICGQVQFYEGTNSPDSGRVSSSQSYLFLEYLTTKYTKE